MVHTDTLYIFIGNRPSEIYSLSFSVSSKQCSFHLFAAAPYSGFFAFCSHSYFPLSRCLLGSPYPPLFVPKMCYDPSGAMRHAPTSCGSSCRYRQLCQGDFCRTSSLAESVWLASALRPSIRLRPSRRRDAIRRPGTRCLCIGKKRCPLVSHDVPFSCFAPRTTVVSLRPVLQYSKAA